MLLKKKVTLDLFYYMPDHNSLLQEFIWQTMDITPELPRIHKFLSYWHDHIEATIAEINVSYSHQNTYRSVDLTMSLH